MVKLWIVLTLLYPDAKIDSFFQTNLKSPHADILLKTLSRSADNEIIAGSLLIYNFLGDSSVGREVKEATVGWMGTGLTISLLKFLFNRERPDSSGGSRFSSSFPSFHTGSAFFIASYFSLRHPKTALILYPWAVGVGVSRIYLRKHWFWDVVGGSLIGLTGGYLTVKLFPK